MTSHRELTRDHALRLAREVWGLEATSAEPLPGERDENFLIRSDGGLGYVLKVAPRGATAEEVRLETGALDWLARSHEELPVPRLLVSLTGDTVVGSPEGAGAPRLARLVTYLPGRVLAEVRPRTEALLEDLGRLLGRLDRAFEGFEPPALRPPDFDWDPRNAGRVMAGAERYLVGERLRLLRWAAERFHRDALPALGDLPCSVIHGDANDHNVLVEPPPQDPPRPAERVAGIIDFGDLMVAPRVGEPAIAAAYALLGTSEPVHAAAALFRGYHSEWALQERELAVAWALVAARLGTSVALSATRAEDGRDDPYLFVSEGAAWEALERMALLHPRYATAVLRAACGFEPCARSAAVRSWLRGARPRAALLEGDRLGAPLPLDLSVGSTDLPGAVAAAGGALFARHVARKLEDAGTQVGVGRYGEARSVLGLGRTGLPHGSGDRPPTVHLGIDLFAPPGTRVRAPLAGHVHAVWHPEAGDHGGATVVLEHAPEGGSVFWTIYAHFAPGSTAALEVGRPVVQGEQIGALGRHHLHFQISVDLLDDAEGRFPEMAPGRERDVWTSFSPDPALLLSLPEGSSAPPAPGVASLIGRRRAALGPNLSLSYRAPLHVERGWMQHLYDSDGLPYLDCVNNVAHVGHAHPRVVEAAASQKGVLETNTRYLHERVLELAERLAALLPPPLEVCWFVNSGSEANELALRIARTVTGRRDVVVLSGGYHGNTAALVDVSPYKHLGPGGAGTPAWVHVVPAPDAFRGPHRRGDPDLGPRYAVHVAAAVERAGQQGGVAAFLHESLLSCAGQIEPPPGYLEAAYRSVREAGGFVIADEVQVGLGRVGTHFWGFETQGVVPDIVTLGKPFGNGHPLGVVITTRPLADAFANGMEYFNTFGGNPASAAVGTAVLDVIREEALQARAHSVGSLLMDGLRTLAAENPSIGDVRGRGLFLGVELVQGGDPERPDAPLADYLVQRARERGVLLSTDGPDHNVIKIKPPLAFGAEDAQRVVGLLEELLAEDFPRGR